MQWKITGATVRGTSHIRKDLPNQDSILCHPDSGHGLPVILAISDGHGSSKSFRSDKGSCFAVQAAVETISEFLINLHAEIGNFTHIRQIAEEQLPKEIVRRWKTKVKDDLTAAPFSENESAIIDGRGNDDFAYGATLLTIAITESFIVYLQLGDGDILTLWDNGQVEQPIPKDDRLFANETTSLCGKESWRDFRCCFQPIFDISPKLILAATDGYANSFRDEESFLKVAPDIFGLIESEGIDFVETNLKDWLNDASESGSGDDVTVGIITELR